VGGWYGKVGFAFLIGQAYSRILPKSLVCIIISLPSKAQLYRIPKSDQVSGVPKPQTSLSSPTIATQCIHELHQSRQDLPHTYLTTRNSIELNRRTSIFQSPVYMTWWSCQTVTHSHLNGERTLMWNVHCLFPFLSQGYSNNKEHSS